MVSLFCAIVGEAGGVFEVNIDAGVYVSALKKVIKEENEDVMVPFRKLQLFLAKKSDAWLRSDDIAVISMRSGSIPTQIKELLHEEINPADKIGNVFGDKPPEKMIHVLVVIPPQAPPQGALAPAVQIPEFNPLENWKQYPAECLLDQWKAGKVRKIPLIWQFMESCGGCTTKKKIFWREEEKQVASILLERWFREPSGDSSNDKCVLVGSPGIGKSTLLIVMAFFLVFKHKKNVLVYRRLTKVDQGYCLLYLGYQKGKVVFFTVQKCLPELAVAIYLELDKRSDVWLLLDGFLYESIPPGLVTFRMLATSQQAELKQSEREEAYRCLLPCWKKRDLFKLGKKVYKFEKEDMEDRFYFSGGSVRVFAKEKADHLNEMSKDISEACTKVEDALLLFSDFGDIQTGKNQVDQLRQTFVKDTQDPDNYLDSSNWEQRVDSQYATSLLSKTIRSEPLLRFFHWARAAGHGSLAGAVFETFLHRLATDNSMILHISEYAIKSRKKRKNGRSTTTLKRYKDTEILKLKLGRAFASSAAAQVSSSKKKLKTLPEDLQTELENWRDDDNMSYWYPLCDNFPNIDSIVKLKPSFIGGNVVAFLQITIAEEHKIDGKQLALLKDVFNVHGANPSIYIALCPNRKSFETLNLATQKKLAEAQQVCRVFAGYYEEPPPQHQGDDPRNGADTDELLTSSSAQVMRTISSSHKVRPPKNDSRPPKRQRTK